ncbi:MAG: DUF4159 domain-containing protein [Planctomycetota bacterium]|nr:DUF4159 domain-containing protein [Planctomycetota bacterium]
MNARRMIVLIVAATALVPSGGDGVPGRGSVLGAGADEGAPAEGGPGVVQCANLIYGQDKSSVCFAEEFLALLQRETNIRTNRRFYAVKSDSVELYQYPFAIMTGEGTFTLTPAQRANLRKYLQRGGFLVASPGCSSTQWDACFRAEIQAIFPEIKLRKIPMSHPIFHIVFDVTALDTTHSGPPGYLEGLEIDGKIVMVYSSDGLNDTANAGPGCCCCGGNEVRNARQINANLLAYALLH